MVRPNNASMGTAILNNRPLRERRGCELYPDHIDFGTLKEGNSTNKKTSKIKIIDCYVFYRCHLRNRDRNKERWY